VDASLWPGYEDWATSGCVCAHSQARDAQVDTALLGPDAAEDDVSGCGREIPVGIDGPSRAALTLQQPVGIEASVERGRLGRREVC
jgi:hypothetical protein